MEFIQGLAISFNNWGILKSISYRDSCFKEQRGFFYPFHRPQTR